MRETADDRRSKRNLHTIDELKASGNIYVGYSEDGSLLTMRRGKTFTTYARTIEENQIYWKPFHAITTS